MSPCPLGYSLVCVEKFHLWDPTEMRDRVPRGVQADRNAFTGAVPVGGETVNGNMGLEV